MCALCRQIGERTQSTTVVNVYVEEKLKESYEDIHDIPLLTEIFNQQMRTDNTMRHHCRYTYTFKDKLSSAKVRNCLSTHHLLPVACTNYEFLSLLIPTAPHQPLNIVNKISSMRPMYSST
ncbi:unnamed protein product [Rotaria sordida]|uniref:Uncharacterized protein n=1 Tax=Rotaria sordida TaxID=392033 RepID=A0A819L0V2_9BILA|nr:unnamed protein product [Rotaria sordida]CAF1008883.1 unnamed protein product [Rotaria sordida]CAF1144992.1 unnamed protein product [Rotaria sordida]CAF1386504.1 unnamed protein product [Rotaria sordida]CAF3635301.1 unnamed protein product [Rotaria sordida]